MAAAIEEQFPQAHIELRKGGGGDFIVKRLDGDGVEELWNKKAKHGGFPTHDQILSQLG